MSATGARVVLTIDSAGWHKAGGRLHCQTMSRSYTAARQPGDDPIQNVAVYQRINKLSDRIVGIYKARVDVRPWIIAQPQRMALSRQS